jgi:hypothetical protein
MSQTLAAAVSALRQAGERLVEVGARIAMADPGAGAFGASGPGGLGDLGQASYQLWQHALDARAREAASHAARVDEVADAVSRASAGYADVDDAARRRSTEVA